MATLTLQRGSRPQRPTLRSHLEVLSQRAGESPTLTAVIEAIGSATAIISEDVRRAALADVLGATGEINVQGEQVQKLDNIANRELIDALRGNGGCAGYASEELEKPLTFESDEEGYLVSSDPLDGSTNVDVNVSTGTIFAIWRGPDGREVEEADFLQPGRALAAGGYVLYGPASIMVLAAYGGVHIYTLDPDSDDFLLTAESMKCPDKGSIYSVNEGYYNRWSDGVRAWNTHLKEENKAESRPYTHRYVGSLVADAHRTLLKGGIFAYPADSKSPEGKLRLMYEANPIGFVFETAGGAATSGRHPILEIEPKALHQRTPLIFGSAEDVATFLRIADG